MDEVICTNCNWSGTEDELINPRAIGRDLFIEGDSCPDCGFEIRDYELDFQDRMEAEGKEMCYEN